MKTIKEYISEKLNDRDEILWSYLKRKDLLSGNEVALRKFALSIDPTLSKYIDTDTGEWNNTRWDYVIDDTTLQIFLNKHGLSDRETGIQNAAKWIKNVFTTARKPEELNNIIQQNGICEFQDLINRQSGDAVGNIFDICSEKGLSKDIAEIISVKTSKKNDVSIGSFEFLLRMMCKDSTVPKKGDLVINKRVLIEMKTNGGVLKSQKNYKTITEMTNFIYHQILSAASLEPSGAEDGKQNEKSVEWNENISKSLNIDTILTPNGGGFFNSHDEKRADYPGTVILEKFINYFAKEQGNFLKVYPSVNVQDDHNIFVILAKGISMLYGKENDKRSVEFIASSLSRLGVITYKDNEYKVEHKKLIEAVGAAQLFLYHRVEDFSYFMIIDKKTSQYKIIDFTKSVTLSKILSICTFTGNKSDDAHGGSCRVTLRKVKP